MQRRTGCMEGCVGTLDRRNGSGVHSSFHSTVLALQRDGAWSARAHVQDATGGDQAPLGGSMRMTETRCRLRSVT